MTPDQVFAEMHGAIGGRLFTIGARDVATGAMRRVYTSNGAAFPLTGPQPAPQVRWSLHVLIEGEPFIANTADELADVFPDTPDIAALGCGAALNLPVFDGDVELGTVNVFDVEGFFDDFRVFALQSLVVARQDALVAAMRAV